MKACVLTDTVLSNSSAQLQWMVSHCLDTHVSGAIQVSNTIASQFLVLWKWFGQHTLIHLDSYTQTLHSGVNFQQTEAMISIDCHLFHGSSHRLVTAQDWSLSYWPSTLRSSYNCRDSGKLDRHVQRHPAVRESSATAAAAALFVNTSYHI